ncbi:MAG: ATP-dependent RNA/DNA helicase IGHMBP2, partial [Myxococcota bacterium]
MAGASVDAVWHLDGMSERSEKALESLRTAWLQERQTARVRALDERVRLSFKARVVRGVALGDLAVDEIAPVAGGRFRVWLSPRSGASLDRQTLRLRPGTPVVLYRHTPDDPLAKGVVGRFSRGRIAVAIRGSDLDAVEGEAGIRLDREAPEATFERGEKAIRIWEGATPRTALETMREVCFGEGPVGPDLERQSTTRETLLDGALNASQREAVEFALSTTPIALIHGPPGTGKTRTLVALIREAVARGDRVLACAASNIAVDNMAERLAAAGVPIVRMGHPERVLPSVEALTLDVLVDATEGAQLARRWITEAHAIRRRMFARSDRGRLDYHDRREMMATAG